VCVIQEDSAIMSFDIAKLEDHIERLRGGDTLTENEVKALCEKVRYTSPWSSKSRSTAVVHNCSHGTVRCERILRVISGHVDR
jgi:hypothetical protein